MTAIELVQALRQISVETGSLVCLDCEHEHTCGIHGCAIMRTAADRIEQLTAEPTNEPLTLEELRGMDGEPVWAGNEKEPQHFQWFLVDCGSAYKPFILINRHDNLMWQYMKSPAHPDGWTAYRRKPDGGGER